MSKFGYMKRIQTVLLAAMIFPLVLGGCTAAFLSTAARDIFVKDNVNLVARHNAVADVLIQQASPFINRDRDVIAVRPLTEIGQADELTADIASIIPEQIGVRMTQLSYIVDLRDVVSADTQRALGPRPSGTPDAPFLLVGTYVRTDTSELEISLRMYEKASGRVIAVHDYSLPLTNTLADLSEPAPRIMRIERLPQ